MRLRKRAEEIVDMIEKTEAECAVKKGSVEGDVHIGAGETRVRRHVVEVIHELRKDYFSEGAFKKLKGENKELLSVPGASHTDLYDRIDVISFDTIEAFFKSSL